MTVVPNNKKSCPLNPSTDEWLSCSQEKCAWWDEDAQECAVLSLSKSIRKGNRNGR